MSADRSRLRNVLAAVFLVAMVMGPGPGLYLVNPDAEGGPPPTWFGMPVLYVWALMWFVVLASVLVVAHLRLWSDGAGPGASDSAKTSPPAERER
jgi:hypothetical protein